MGMEDFERYGPVVLEVVSQEDGGHATAPQLTLDSVAVGQSRLKAIQDIRPLNASTRTIR
jgi:hypothetical protein